MSHSAENGAPRIRDDAPANPRPSAEKGLPDIEVVAAAVHEAWMETKRAQGVTSRPSEWGEEQMVPYSDLSERAKELDRATVRSVYAAIRSTSDPHTAGCRDWMNSAPGRPCVCHVAKGVPDDY